MSYFLKQPWIAVAKRSDCTKKEVFLWIYLREIWQNSADKCQRKLGSHNCPLFYEDSETATGGVL